MRTRAAAVLAATTVLTSGVVVLPAASASTPGAVAPVSAVQGRGPATALTGEVVVEAVVTSVLTGPGELGGFFVEEQRRDRDRDDRTSEGVFVQAPAGGPTVRAGDVVTVRGTPAERFAQTVLVAAEVRVTGGRPDLPSPAAVRELPRADAAARDARFEPLEGMRVRLAGTWTVTDTYGLGRSGEVDLVPGRDPLVSPTTAGRPGPRAGAAEDAQAAGLASLVLDDAADGRPATAPYLVDGSLRRGSTVRSLEAVLSVGFGQWRLRPLSTTTSVRFEPAPLPGVPRVGGDVRVASFNVLNYFDGDGRGGGFPTARGARTPEDFERQAAKVVAALRALDADVVGLSEVENDGVGDDSAVGDLLRRLNAGRPAAERYAAVPAARADGRLGSDAIRNQVIYRPAALTLTGWDALDDVDPFTRNTRPPLAATFLRGGEEVTVVMNHFKSKGSGEGANADAGDGQGASNADRVLAATALDRWVDARWGERRVVLLGDFNAYRTEDPLQVLERAGWTSLEERSARGERPYSYVFNGAQGALDHAFANRAARRVVTGAAAWHVNADEPVVLQYATAPGLGLYRPDARASSDHDPVLVGLDL